MFETYSRWPSAKLFWMLLGVAWLVPVASVLVASVLSADLANPAEIGRFVGIDNYREAIRRGDFLKSVVRSVHLVLLTIPVSAVLGLAIAGLLQQLRPAGSRFFLVIFSLPLFLPGVTSALIWYFQFSPDYGPFGSHVSRMFGVILLSPDMALYSIALVEIWKLTSLYVLIAYVMFRGVPASLWESRAIYGVPLATYWISLMVPLNKNVLKLGLALGVIQVSRSMESVFLITRGGPGVLTETFPVYIYRVIFERYEFGYGGASSVLYDLLIFSVIFALTWGSRRGLHESTA